MGAERLLQDLSLELRNKWCALAQIRLHNHPMTDEQTTRLQELTVLFEEDNGFEKEVADGVQSNFGENA